MKSLRVVALLLLLVLTFCDDHQPLELDKPFEQSLDQSTMFTGKYVFEIPEQNVKKMTGDKWFFFVQVEPNQQNQWVSSSIQLSVAKKGEKDSTNERICASRRGGVDSCYFTNKQFDYKTEEIHVNVRCMGPCKFKISGEISEPYKLTIGQSIEMDFQNTAYSKIFQLDTRDSSGFDQLRIILKPTSFLQFPAPIGLYINKGTSIPSRKNHDFQSITLWDSGQGVFLDVPQANNIFTILVEGPEKNVLVLQTKLVSFKESELLEESIPHFDYLGEGAAKLYKCKVDPKKGLNIFLSTFSGATILKRILDQQKKEIKNEFPMLYRSFSEIEYQIPVIFFKDNESKYKIQQYLIFEIEGVEESTFLFEYYSIDNTISHLLPEVNRYIELGPKEYNQYYLELVELDIEEFKHATIEIVLTHQSSKNLTIKFFKCQKEHGSECQIKKVDFDQVKIDSSIGKEITPGVIEHYGEGVSVNKFTIPAQQFKSNKDVKEYILGIIVTNPSSSDQLYTISYKNIGHNTYLKQMEAHKDRLSIDQQRYYIYTNRQSDIKEIRVHLMQISGRVKIEGYTSDPRYSDLEGQEITDFHNMLRFTNIKENQTIFIKVTGKEMAYFSIQVQSMKETQKDWWNRTHGNRGKFYNQIAIFQEIPYQFTLQPKEKVVYQIHSKHATFILDMNSLLPLELCMTEQLTKPPFSPNCEVKQTLSSNELEKVTLERGSIGNIGVINNNDKVNKFNIRFYTTDEKETQPDGIPSDNYTVAKCFPAVLGKVTKYSIKQETGTCYTYLMFKEEDIELSFNVVSHQFDKVNVIAAVGDIQRIEILGGTKKFKKQEISRSCKELFPCTLKLFIESQISTDLVFTLQYIDDVVFLLDGIANQFSGVNSNRYFAYQLMNHVNTTVILENRVGSFNFYALVVQANDFWNNKSKHPSAEQNTIKSTNPFYYNYQLSQLTETMIKESKCKECLLLITVQRGNSPVAQDEKTRFSIECTQQNRILKQNDAVHSYLNKHSFAFYEFDNKQEGTVLISLNTQNKQCANVYVKKGENRATGADFDYQGHYNILIQNAEKAHYSVTVQAKDNCYYSIDFTSSTSKIYSVIQPGMFSDVRLDKDDEHNLVYHHTEDKGFKILTLHQQGEVIINVNKYASARDYLEENNKKKKHVWSGRDFLRIEKNDSNFCYNCYYVISLTGQRQTRTSLIIPTETTQIPIMVDSLITEQMKKGEKEVMRVYSEATLQFEINVHYGSVNISLTSQENQHQLIFTKIYKSNQKSQYQIINTTSKQSDISYGIVSFTRIVVKAEQDTGFSFGVISDKDENKRSNRIKYGIPQYVILEQDQTECMIGRLDDSNQQFLLSITGDNQVDLMNNLEVSCKLEDGELLELSKEIAKNQMIVKIDKPAKKVPSDYEFCLKSKQSIFLTFVQSSRLVYLPQATNFMVSGTMNFTFYSEGKSILEINQCKSRAVATIFHSFSTSDRVNSEIRQVRKTNNVIEFMYYGPVYLQVETKSSTIAWKKKDELKMTGFGYDKYSASKLRYQIEGDNLKVYVFELNQIQNELSVPLKDFNYSVYLAQEEMNLYDAMNCHNGNFVWKTFHYKEKATNITAFSFDINQILQKFGTKKYILIGAMVNSSSTVQGDSGYRFFYPYQEIPIAALKGETITQPPVKPVPTNPDEESSSILKILALIVLGLFALLIVYKLWLEKVLKKRRMSRLNQQGGEVRYQQFASYTS